MRSDSPEDRLLHLIKGKYKKKSDAAQVQKTLGQKSISSELTKKVFLESKVLKPSHLNPVNQILVIILVTLLMYLAYSLLFPGHK